jgi:hypothetical protein
MEDVKGLLNFRVQKWLNRESRPVRRYCTSVYMPACSDRLNAPPAPSCSFATHKESWAPNLCFQSQLLLKSDDKVTSTRQRKCVSIFCFLFLKISKCHKHSFRLSCLSASFIHSIEEGNKILHTDPPKEKNKQKKTVPGK